VGCVAPPAHDPRSVAASDGARNIYDDVSPDSRGVTSDVSDGPDTTNGSTVMAGRVVRVVDGDTIHVVVDGVRYKVRLIGIDTPETTRETEPYGEEASRYARSILDGRQVRLETDIELRDRYDRLLAYVWLEPPDPRSSRPTESTLFNAKLVAEGYAQIYTFPPNIKYADLFLRLQRSAREEGRGLWGIPNAADPLTGKRAEELP
jgi:micrococcal nuclease